jgi:hypothetical protein
MHCAACRWYGEYNLTPDGMMITTACGFSPVVHLSLIIPATGAMACMVLSGNSLRCSSSSAVISCHLSVPWKMGELA